MDNGIHADAHFGDLPQILVITNPIAHVGDGFARHGLIKYHDVMPRLCKFSDNVASNPPQSARDQDFHTFTFLDRLS
jgi:hypothetical protein